MKGFVGRVAKSAATWPTTIMLLIAAAVGVCLSESLFEWPIGVLMLLVAWALIITAAAARVITTEIGEVHQLVNGQRDILVKHVAVLEETLRNAGLTIPADPIKDEMQAHEEEVHAP